MPSRILGQRVLVTGAQGFIGRALVAFAEAAGARVVGIDRGEADVCNAQDLERVLTRVKPEVVLHAAGLVDWRQDPRLVPSMLAVHVLGTANLLEAARRAGAARVVCFGSAGEYGAAPSPVSEDGPTEPLDPYSTSKYAATALALLYHRSFALQTTVVRPFNVYGPGEPDGRLFPSLFRQALQGGGDFDCTEGTQIRDFVHIDDVVEGAWRAALAVSAGGVVVNLGTGRGTSVRNAIECAVGVSGGIVRPRFGALPYRKGEPIELVAAIDRCQSVLGWTPRIELVEGLRRTYQLLLEKG
jgi:nucleoside-diphosphate-sugar epimerase